MTTTISHPHAEFDLYPALLEDLAHEFGTEGLTATAARIIAAEAADFYWEGRIAERLIDTFEDIDEGTKMFRVVEVLGYFKGRYYTANCIVEMVHRVNWMANLRTFESYEEAAERFVAGG